MQKLSIVIPTYTLNKELETLALEAIRSYRAYADELIVTEDGGRYSSEIMAKVDTYIYNWQNKGFTANVNRGWRQATGDFVAIVSSDTYLFEGNPRDLMIEGKVTSPEIINQNIDLMAGPFFVTPKEVTKERGYLREEMRTYSSDSEYESRIRDIFQLVPEVKIYHHQAQSVKVAGVEGGDEMQRDREIYQKLKEKGL